CLKARLRAENALSAPLLLVAASLLTPRAPPARSAEAPSTGPRKAARWGSEGGDVAALPPTTLAPGGLCVPGRSSEGGGRGLFVSSSTAANETILWERAALDSLADAGAVLEVFGEQAGKDPIWGLAANFALLSRAARSSGDAGARQRLAELGFFHRHSSLASEELQVYAAHARQLLGAMREEFRSCLAEEDLADLLSVVRADAHTLRSQEGSGLGLFPWLHLANHSCSPNAFYAAERVLDGSEARAARSFVLSDLVASIADVVGVSLRLRRVPTSAWKRWQMPGQRKGDAENPQDSVGNSPAASEESGLSSQLYSQDNFKLYSQDFVSVLTSVPGVKHGPAGYSNLTPWVKTFFFVHTYYVYIYVFYMFVLAFYKGYALEYPQALQSREILLIMTIPALQHLRFFFGHWGCELGMPADLCAFLALCSMTMFALMYFLFYQAYIMPL
ncbi:unnamed protein product, partial [Polarella glacialis]